MGGKPGIFEVLEKHSDKIGKLYLSDIHPSPIQKAKHLTEKLPEEQKQKIKLQEEPHTREYISPIERADVAISSWVTWLFERKEAKEYLKKIVDGIKPGGIPLLRQLYGRKKRKTLEGYESGKVDSTISVLLYRKKERKKEERKR